MSSKTPEQKRARMLQEQVGWSYMECLRCVKTMTEDEIDDLILKRSVEGARGGGKASTREKA